MHTILYMVYIIYVLDICWSVGRTQGSSNLYIIQSLRAFRLANSCRDEFQIFWMTFGRHFAGFWIVFLPKWFQNGPPAPQNQPWSDQNQYLV